MANLYAGMAEPNGWIYSDDDMVVKNRVNRIIHRYGASARLVHKSVAVSAFLKINDWNIYDYYRDWNYTYPLQLMGDVSFSLGKPKWFDDPETRIGIRGLYRTPRQVLQSLPGRVAGNRRCAERQRVGNPDVSAPGAVGEPAGGARFPPPGSASAGPGFFLVRRNQPNTCHDIRTTRKHLFTYRTKPPGRLVHMQ